MHAHDSHQAHDEPAENQPGKPIPRDPEDDAAAPGRADVTPSSQGLGAIYGDADRTPNPGPVRPPNAADAANMEAVDEEYAVETTGRASAT